MRAGTAAAVDREGAPEGDRSRSVADAAAVERWLAARRTGPRRADAGARTPCRPTAPMCSGPSCCRSDVDRPRFVRAIEFRPGNARVVHHANLGVDRTRSSRQLDARDPEPGYVGGMVRDARYPEGQMLGWTPGQAPHPSPDGMPWRLEPGSDLVVAAAPAADRQARAAAGVGRLLLHRCAADARPARPAARQRDDRHPRRRRATTWSPTDTSCRSTWSCLAIQPHAHNLARRMEANATLPDGSARPLIAIADWDFRWQDVYRYAAPIALPEGHDDLRCATRTTTRRRTRAIRIGRRRASSGDRTRRTRWATCGCRSCRAPAADFARARARRSAGRRIAEDLARVHEAARGRSRQRRCATTRSAICCCRRGASTRRSIGTGDRSAESGVGVRRTTTSATPCRRADAGDEAIARASRGAADRSRLRAGAQQPRRAAAAARRPRRGAGAYRARGGAPAGQRRRAARTSRSCCRSRGRPAEAVVRFRAALAIDGGNAQALSGLAWIRATASDPALRDASEAVALAERAAAGASRSVAAFDALAAAYASAGRFEEAVKRRAVGNRPRVCRRPARGGGAIPAAPRSSIRQRKPFRMSIQLFDSDLSGKDRPTRGISRLTIPLMSPRSLFRTSGLTRRRCPVASRRTGLTNTYRSGSRRLQEDGMTRRLLLSVGVPWRVCSRCRRPRARRARLRAS